LKHQESDETFEAALRILGENPHHGVWYERLLGGTTDNAIIKIEKARWTKACGNYFVYSKCNTSNLLTKQCYV
jgi:hypothetical protein